MLCYSTIICGIFTIRVVWSTAIASIKNNKIFIFLIFLGDQKEMNKTFMLVKVYILQTLPIHTTTKNKVCIMIMIIPCTIIMEILIIKINYNKDITLYIERTMCVCVCVMIFVVNNIFYIELIFNPFFCRNQLQYLTPMQSM